MAVLGAIWATGCAYVLLRSGWWKLRHRLEFAAVLRENGLPARWLPVALPGVELVVGAAALVLLLPPAVRPSATLPMLGLALLGIAFAAYSGARLATGHRGARCGCVNAEDRLGTHTVVRAVAIAGGGVAGQLAAGSAAPLPGLLWPLTTAVGGTVVAAVLLVRRI